MQPPIWLPVEGACQVLSMEGGFAWRSARPRLQGLDNGHAALPDAEDQNMDEAAAGL